MSLSLFAKRFTKAASLAAGLFLATHAGNLLHAQENYLVHWEGKYAENETLLNVGDSVFTDDGEVWGLETVSLLSPAAYYDIHAPSAKFYGILESKSTGETTGSPQARIVKEADGNDRMVFRSAGAVGDQPAVTYQGLLFWRKEDFLIPEASNSSLTSEMLRDLSLQIAFVRGDAEIRFAVLSGGEWYLSEAAWTNSTGASGNSNEIFVLDDLLTTAWGKWPQSSSSVQLEAPPLTYLTEGNKLTDITAVGFYFTTTFKKNNRASFEFLSFSVASK